MNCEVNEIEDLNFRVLGWHEDDYDAAVAIGLDIWGFGTDKQDALENLRNQMKVRLAFMHKTGRQRLAR